MFETDLLVRVAVLGRCLIRLFLTARYERLDLQPFLKDGKYRPGENYAERTLKTFYGKVIYGRHYLMSRGGGSGFFPLDLALGLPSGLRIASSFKCSRCAKCNSREPGANPCRWGANSGCASQFGTSTQIGF
jgi:hypothetical protein